MVVTTFYIKSGKASNAMLRALTYLIQLRDVIPQNNMLTFRLNFLVIVASSSWRNLSQKSDFVIFMTLIFSTMLLKSPFIAILNNAPLIFLNLLVNLTIAICSVSLPQFFLWLFFLLIFKPAKYPIPIKTQRSKLCILHFDLVVFALFLSRSATNSFFLRYIVLCGLSWRKRIVNTWKMRLSSGWNKRLPFK